MLAPRCKFKCYRFLPITNREEVQNEAEPPLTFYTPTCTIELNAYVKVDVICRCATEFDVCLPRRYRRKRNGTCPALQQLNTVGNGCECQMHN